MFNAELVGKYPEIEDSIQFEIQFFRTRFASKFRTIEECRVLFKNLVPEVKSMFPQVEKLLRLLLISPASSCEAERTFSALRRMKTWLRSTMTQERLESVMICNIHHEKLMKIDPKALAKRFITGDTDTSAATRALRLKIFGHP